MIKMYREDKGGRMYLLAVKELGWWCTTSDSVPLESAGWWYITDERSDPRDPVTYLEEFKTLKECKEYLQMMELLDD